MAFRWSGLVGRPVARAEFLKKMGQVRQSGSRGPLAPPSRANFQTRRSKLPEKFQIELSHRKTILFRRMRALAHTDYDVSFSFSTVSTRYQPPFFPRTLSVRLGHAGPCITAQSQAA